MRSPPKHTETGLGLVFVPWESYLGGDLREHKLGNKENMTEESRKPIKGVVWDLLCEGSIPCGVLRRHE